MSLTLIEQIVEVMVELQGSAYMDDIAITCVTLKPFSVSRKLSIFSFAILSISGNGHSRISHISASVCRIE